MNKAELIDAMANEADLTKAEAKKALEAFVKVTSEALGNGDKISLVGFGSFAVVERSARTGRNPQTKQPMEIAAKKAVKFIAGAELKTKVQ